MKHLQWDRLIVGYGSDAVCSIGSGSASADVLTTVRGRNGSGKTTFLKTLAGILPPIEGTIDPSPGPRLATYLHSVPWLFRGSVRHNLALAGDAERVQEEARRLEVEDLLDARVSKLSRGQAQRVALARAMVRDSPVLLLDEPEGSLDSQSLYRWVARIERCVREQSHLVILATHHPREWNVPHRSIDL